MKKSIIIIIMISIFLIVDASINKPLTSNTKINNKDLKFVYISYLEYLSNFSGNGRSINEAKIDKMIDNIKEYNFNAIFLHTSPFSDSIYPSKYLPYSYTLTGTEGKNPGFDYLEYFIKKAHAKNIQVHAWINPYRISLDNKIDKLSTSNPAYLYQKTNNIGISSKGIYYNPTSSLVKNLILSFINELINNYDIDGIHFDDYFYVDYDIDKDNYQDYTKNGGNKSLKEYRLEHTTDLVKKVYDLIKKHNSKIIFSIAPDGNLNNNYQYHYADVKKWINNHYIDYIMPQLYYGFENEYLPFEKAYDIWNNLVKDSEVSLIPVLAMYKVGSKDNNAGSGKNEWLISGVIEKQINFLNEKNNFYGFGIFRYDYMFNKSLLNETLKKEISNIQKIM